MALWKESAEKETFGDNNKPETDVTPVESTLRTHRRPEESHKHKETVISAGLTIEGKIEGEGDVRIAGRFDGDVQVQGDLTVEPGAHISGQIHAGTVTVGGEVEGNIEATTQVTLLESGQIIGDLKAATLIVAAGSRMRGKVEFGWDERGAGKIEIDRKIKKVTEKVGNGSTL
jgi:cytoskeletal protein CcmA (bactofilin family)